MRKDKEGESRASVIDADVAREQPVTSVEISCSFEYS